MKYLSIFIIIFLSLNLIAKPKDSELPLHADILNTIDPFDGSYKYQLSLPLNFTGNLYFRTLNVSKFASKKIFVMFNINHDPNSVYIPATLATGKGPTENVNSEYLVIETRGQPFSNINFFPLRCRLFGYCPETTSIQIVSFDPETNQSYVVASDTRTKIFFRHPDGNNQGKEVLFEDYQPCQSSAQCSIGNCCYNERCWSRNLIGQCIEDSSFQHQPEGNLCSSHYECESLCCDVNTSTCQPHTSKDGSSFLCNQPVGTFCVDKTWCQKKTIQECKILKTGTSDTGAVTCGLFCQDRIDHGSCVNHICLPPPTLHVPFFDPANPDCSSAVDSL